MLAGLPKPLLSPEKTFIHRSLILAWLGFSFCFVILSTPDLLDPPQNLLLPIKDTPAHPQPPTLLSFMIYCLVSTYKSHLVQSRSSHLGMILPLRGHMVTLETVLVVRTGRKGGCTGDSVEQGPGMLLSILHAAGRPRQPGAIQAQAQIALRARNSGLVCSSAFYVIIASHPQEPFQT